MPDAMEERLKKPGMHRGDKRRTGTRRNVMETQAQELWQEHATRLHFTLEFGTSSQALVACVAKQESSLRTLNERALSDRQGEAPQDLERYAEAVVASIQRGLEERRSPGA